MNNRRDYDRLPVEGTVDLRIGRHIYRGWLQDVCFRGFGAFSTVAQWQLAQGAVVEFNIGIASVNETLEGKGIIRHVREVEKNDNKVFILGVEFADVNKDDVGYIIKRLHLKFSEGLKREGPSEPIDFIPY